MKTVRQKIALLDETIEGLNNKIEELEESVVERKSEIQRSVISWLDNNAVLTNRKPVMAVFVALKSHDQKVVSLNLSASELRMG